MKLFLLPKLINVNFPFFIFYFLFFPSCSLDTLHWNENNNLFIIKSMADRLCQLFQFVLFLLASRAHKQWHWHSAWRRHNVSEELQKNKQQKIVEESSNSQEINQFLCFWWQTCCQWKTTWCARVGVDGSLTCNPEWNIISLHSTRPCRISKRIEKKGYTWNALCNRKCLKMLLILNGLLANRSTHCNTFS